MGTNLGDLLRGAGLKSNPTPEPEPAGAAEVVPDEPTFAPKVVVRMMRKGRGGRTVTVVSGVLTGRDQIAQVLRKQLGVGTRLEGETVVIQGNQVERVARWFESKGVKRVVRS
jgi:translation initiation factor 1